VLLALATNPKDVDRASDLISWIGELGSYPKHWMLLIGAFTLDESIIFQLAAQARTCGFKQVVSIRAKTEPDNPWPQAANHMFHLAADYAANHARVPFFWIEPDCAPMREGWLDAIEAEYQAMRKAFMGTVYDQPYRHMNGVGCYPDNIRRYNPLMFNAEFAGLPFDTVRPDLVLNTRNAHVTRLIHRSLEDPATNTAHHFATMDDLSIIPRECLLFHGCKDGSLIARLREQRNGLSTVINPPLETGPTLKERFVQGMKKLISWDGGPFYHSGNLGDVVYGLPAIKAVGGGDLIIGPEQRKTALCAVPIDKKQFEMFKPLLDAQSYLKHVAYSEKYPPQCRDLNHFRTIWNTPALRKKHDITTLCQAHFLELGVLDKFDAQEQAAWLTCTKPMETGKLIVHRSPRYNAPATGKDSFPWQRAVDKYHEDMLFVGLESEHDAFCRNFGKKVSFWKVKDFMEMANIIAGGKVCLMNQSFPLSIAIGLGKRVVCEALPRSPDCRFFRNSYTDQLLEKDQTSLLDFIDNPKPLGLIA
jgi:hypothetical protein